jgi:3-(3-hydroxy-phenyl)propionate hydroxylase
LVWLAIDARLKGLEVLLLDEDDSVSFGSRAVCYAKRTLEILDRLGVGEPLCEKGVSWNIGRTYVQEEEVYQFNLVPEAGHKRPGMINLQQYYLEEALVNRALELGVDVRWSCKAVGMKSEATHATVEIDSPEGKFSVSADWLIVADGARSPIRQMLGLDIEGHVFKDRFLIADVVMKVDFPAERRLWFNPPFHRGQSVLLHKQADNVWRIDFQLGWDADPEEERKPEKVLPRLKTMFGNDTEFELEWVSIYTFQCRRMKEFRHQRLLFVGDAAHQVSPFGARGANSGLQDADGLIWKLDLVMRGLAPETLLDTYHDERAYAADENILNSTRSTDFITPKSKTSRVFRDAALELARHHPFARKLVNSGRLSVPSFITHSSLNTAEVDSFVGAMVPGAPMDDAPMQCDGKDVWLIDSVGGHFQCLVFVDDVKHIDANTLQSLLSLRDASVPIEPVLVSKSSGVVEGMRVLVDVQGLFAKRYDAQTGSVWLVRPDQHIAARWRRYQAQAVKQALHVAIGVSMATT